MNLLKEHFFDFWFRPLSATNLCVSRILFFGGMFLYYLAIDFTLFASFPRTFVEPVWALRVTGLPVVSDAGTVTWLQFVWRIALLLAACGIFTRYSCWTSALLGTYLIAVSHSYGKTHHNDALACIFMFVFANSRCGDAWSIDRRLIPRNDKTLKGLVGAEYRWPLQLMCVLFSIMYFAAGFSKLKVSGLHWIYSDYMQMMLLEQHYTASPPTTWAISLAQWPLICHGLAAATILLEIAVPFALFNRWAKRILIPSTYAMHLAIWLLVGPWFLNMILCCLVWPNWKQVFASARRKLPKNQP